MTRCEHHATTYSKRTVGEGRTVLTTETIRCTECEERVVWSTALRTT